MAASVEQQHIQIAFELSDQVGQRRRHATEFVGCAGEAALAVDRIERVQGVEVQDIQNY